MSDGRALDIRVTGLDGAVTALTQLREACGRFAGPIVAVGSGLPYAYGIEFGRRQSGRLARRAGPAYYLRGAYQAVVPGLPARVAPALREGPGATGRLGEQVGQELIAQAARIVPVRSGRLRGSIRAIRTAGGGAFGLGRAA